jgi:methionyl-tRNA formyltransferase
VTIMRPVAELDAGPIAVERAESIHADDDYGSLSERMAVLGAELLVEALDSEPSFREQPDTGATYAEKIRPQDRLLDPELTPDQLERRVRALRPHIGAYVELPWDERLGVTRAAIATDEGPPPGEFAVDDGRLLYGAMGGALVLCEVHPAGKRPMDAESWIRGYGARLAATR